MKRIELKSDAPFPLHWLYEEDFAYAQRFFSSSSTPWRGFGARSTFFTPSSTLWRGFNFCSKLLFPFIDTMKRIQLMFNAPFPLHRLYEEDSASVQSFFSPSLTLWRGFGFCPTLLFLFIDAMKRIQYQSKASFPLHRRYEEDSDSVRRSFSSSLTRWKGFSISPNILFPFIDPMKRIQYQSKDTSPLHQLLKR